MLGSGTTLELAARLVRLKTGKPAFEPFTRRLARIDSKLSPSDLWIAWNDIQQANLELGRFMEEYHLFLTPVLGEPPWKIGSFPQKASTAVLEDKLFRYVGFTPICNTSGFPAMSVPLFWNPAGLPIGVQFIGRFGDESTLLGLAGQLERARPWSERHPANLRAVSGTSRQT